MKNSKPIPKLTRLQLGIILAGFVIVIAGGVWAYYAKIHAPTTPNPTPTPGINEKTDTEQARRQASASPTPSPVASPHTSATPVPPTPTPATLKPTIVGVSGHDSVTATTVSIDALPDTATSGTCAATLTKGATTRTVTSNITIVTSYYACSTLKVDKAQLTAGDWTLVVSVTSPSGTGSSDPQTIPVKK